MTEKLLEMLRWKRPSGDEFSTLMFAQVYLEPVFGAPDASGNYIKEVTKKGKGKPNICFAAHYDTVHYTGGFQELSVKDDVVTAVDSDCLGADCTTGVWLILEMIEAEVPGVYVIHADEEVGCIGSSNLVEENPPWLSQIDAVISFDRFGTDSIITHQCGVRTASDEFAHSLADALNMPELRPDTGGIYTDSNEYRDVVSECTNLSVGYYSQHTDRESQDLIYAEYLKDSLINANWEVLEFVRDPSVYDMSYKALGGGTKYGYLFGYNDEDEEKAYQEYRDKKDLEELILAVPEEIADFLYGNGIRVDDLALEMGIDPHNYIPRLMYAS